MSRIYADIVVDISLEKLDKTFQYEVPSALLDQCEIGKKVRVPFGNGGRELTGYIICFSREPKLDPSRIKPIKAIEAQGMEVESRLISLAGWIAENYASTMNQALKTVLLVKEKTAAKEKRYLTLKLDAETGNKLLEEWQRKKYRARERLMRALLQKNVLDYTQTVQNLKISPKLLAEFAEKGWISIGSQRAYRNPAAAQPRCAADTLSSEQKRVVEEILLEWQKATPRPCLIKGVTGSGKTQVYMELISHVLAKGEQVIVLIPEIALTYQNVSRFYGRFGDCVSLIHSRLSHGERCDQFERAKKGEISIIIGPRSALFTPFPNLGLIIIDEEHEGSYKSEQTPCYHARETAIQRGLLEGAQVVMGSASPSLESYYKGIKGTYKLLYLQQRYGNRKLPEVSIVDLRTELKQGNRSIFSRSLIEKIEDRLRKKEQILLFLNRRGYAGFISCRSCGYVVTCPHCDVSLTAHKHGKLVCHYCGYETSEVKTCPACSSPYIGGFRAGTQQIESLLQQQFPGARVLRMDADTTRKKEDHEKLLAAFARKEADILIGTQMIVKGHDFPEVTLAGVLAADLSLYSSDYRASERTFQLLLQAVGRAGRGEKAGEAVIQTYHPEHYSIQTAAIQDYEQFYDQEIRYRLLMNYPPAAFMVALRGSCKEEELLSTGMHYCKKYVETVYPSKDLVLVGPAPESVYKVQDRYRSVLYMRHAQREVLVKIKNLLEKYIEVNTGFKKIYMQFDFNV